MQMHEAGYSLPHPMDVHILMYHNVALGDELDGFKPYVVTRQQFGTQLRLLKLMGFRSAHLTDVFDEAEGRRPPHGRQVVITFDDCPAHLLDNAIPLLKQHGFTATFFVLSEMLGKSNEWDGDGRPRTPFMTESDIRDLVADGFEIGSHGMQHRNLTECSADERTAIAVTSRNRIRELFDVPCDFFAYPYGDYPDDYATLCREAGYRGAVGITSAARKAVQDPYAIRRVFVHSGDGSLRFCVKMTRMFLSKLAHREARSHSSEKLK